jgi:tRNA nucleotidyltransferase (CCA-adding enzyme)
MTFKEMTVLLETAEHVEEINEYREEIAQWIPQVRIMFGYDQKNHAHPYDLWMHCLHTVTGVPAGLKDDMLYLAALLHDIGKPYCQVAGTKKDDTNMHYYGHPPKSAQIVQEEILPSLLEKGVNISDEEQRRLIYYVYYHDDRICEEEESLRKHLEMVSLAEFKKLMMLQASDARAHVMLPIIAKRVETCERLSGEYADQLYNSLEKR